LHSRRVVIGLSIALGTVLVAGVAVIALTSQHHGTPRSSRTANDPCPAGGICTGVTPTASQSVAGVSPTATQVAVTAPTHPADPAPTHAVAPSPTHPVTPSLTRIVTRPTTPPVAAPVAATPVPTTPAAAPLPAGTVFDEEFNGSTLDTGKWVALNRPGDASNGEQQCYSPSHVSEAGGLLTLRTDVSACPDGKPFTSGAIQMRSFPFTYGTVEFRSKESGGTGTWPAEWLLGSNCQQTNLATADNSPPCAWPNPGSDEIDIAEVMGHNLNTVNQAIHSGGNNDGCRASTSDVSQSWHTYQLVWLPGSLVWKIDGVVTCSKTAGIPSTPMFLIINTAVGGSGGGSVDASTLPQIHQVDYVRISKP
jgi:beta-glucanase (GH16 family)